MRPKYWITKEGVTISVRRMSTRHLINVLRMFREPKDLSADRAQMVADVQYEILRRLVEGGSTFKLPPPPPSPPWPQPQTRAEYAYFSAHPDFDGYFPDGYFP